MAKRYIIGIDEVGRGSLAGPITVAAVLKPKRFVWKNFKDSKKLSSEKREEFFLKFKKMYYAVASVGSAMIDKIGISAATRLAAGRCLKKLAISHQPYAIRKTYGLRRTAYGAKILLDGNLYAPRTYKNQQTITKGDEKVPLIATASIIAKVKRDRAMTRFHKKFPQYNFDIHKGYGTKLHQETIKNYGLCAIHRKTFCKNFYKC